MECHDDPSSLHHIHMGDGSETGSKQAVPYITYVRVMCLRKQPLQYPVHTYGVCEG